MNISKIDIDRRPEREEYEKTIRVWFKKGGSIKHVEDTDGRVIVQAYTPKDPHTVWDDLVIGNTDSGPLEAFSMNSLEVMMEDIQGSETESDLLKAVTGNTSPTPTNVEYE